VTGVFFATGSTFEFSVGIFALSLRVFPHIRATDPQYFMKIVTTAEHLHCVCLCCVS
jgi:hypothetical protein